VRDRLVISAIELLRGRGADGFGMSELLETSGVARRSMYQHFPDGKAQLLEAAVRAAGRHIQGELDAALEDHSPVEALAVWITGWSETLIESDFRLGCPLAAAAQAGTDYPDAARAAADVLQGFILRLTDALISDGFAPDDAVRTAGLLVSGVQGAIVTSRCLRSTAPFDDLLSHARSVWGRDRAPDTRPAHGAPRTSSPLP